jgi:hypothetical protein
VFASWFAVGRKKRGSEITGNKQGIHSQHQAFHPFLPELLHFFK